MVNQVERIHKNFSLTEIHFCLNKCAGIKIPFDKNHHQRYKDGTLYQFEGCEECGYAYKCKEHLKINPEISVQWN